MQLGPTPFKDALGAISAQTLALAFVIGALTTLCSAWRWTLVTSALGVAVPLPTAVAAYYRSQLLNSTLPGGVLGDLHRGVLHGREAGAVGRCVRAVAWERSLGQVVQLSLTALFLLLLSSWAPTLLPILVTLSGTAAVAFALILWRRRPRRTGVVARAISTVAADLSAVIRVRWALTRIVLASTLVVGGHTAIFIVAARASGVSVPLDTLLPVALVVLTASAIPANIAGWGPREGAAAWAFGAAGLSAAQGVTTAVVFGAMVLVATLPGVAVLAATLSRRPRRPAQCDAPTRVPDTVHA